MINKNFEDLIRKSDVFNEKKYLSDNRWKIIENLYNKNYLFNEQKNTITIPKKIHHIWLGSILPEKYRNYINSWKIFNPTYKHYIWTDKDIKNLNLYNQKLYDQTKNFGQKSDILRYEILYRFGGIYVDTDFECLKPFDDFLYLDHFTGVAYPMELEFYIGLIGSKPKHPILRSCLVNMKNISHKSPNDVLETTGTYYYTRCFMENVDENTENVVAFPMDYFYPFPNTNRNTIKDDLERKKYVTENSYAIHHWGVSWVK